MRESTAESRGGPGVPEALPRILRAVRDGEDPRTLDRLWIFPPLVRGRREWGLVAFTRFPDPASGESRRRVGTASYFAEETGRGVTFEPRLQEEGIAPDERLARVISGVVRRSEIEPGDPREVEVGGDPDRIEEVIRELEPDLAARAGVAPAETTEVAP